jgi:hypothetical protein
MATSSTLEATKPLHLSRAACFSDQSWRDALSVAVGLPHCRWDGGATYNYKFNASQVSILDFFHPDLDGQAALARVTWAASWWPTNLAP